MRRRDFLKLVAASGAGAVLFTGCEFGNPEREFLIQSPVQNPEDVIFGRDAWYATAFPGIGGGSGLVVRVFEGRAKKVEGNPDYPLNLGRTKAIEQSLVQEVYHPDRIPGPLNLVGQRGSGEYEPYDWVAGIGALAAALDGARGAILLITGPVSGSLAAVIGEFVEAFDAQHLVWEPDEKIVLREAMRRTFGTERLPAVDLANTGFLLNFGAEFLHSWISPVQLSIGYGEFRQGDRPRGLYYHVGPHLSATAANADRWFYCLPGSEGLVAMSVAQVLATEGLVNGANVEEIFRGVDLDTFAPENVAAASGLSAEQIREIAQAFAANRQAGPSVAIAGTSAAAHTNGLFNLSAAFALNYLAGSVGEAGGLLLNPDSPVPDAIPAAAPGASFSQWRQVVNDMNNGAFDVVLVHGANPLYTLPEASGFRDALAAVPTVVSFASFMDETAAQANLILPDLTTLESWGLHVPDPGPGYPLLALQQPVVLPFVAGQSAGDTLIRAAAEAGTPLPWPTYEEAVRAAVAALQEAGGGNVEGDHPREYFVAMQSQGGWWDVDAAAVAAPAAPPEPITPADPRFAGDVGQYPFHLLPFPTNSWHYGEFAHLPWLQGLPEPISTSVWGSWVELNPQTAEALGVTTESVVRISSPEGSFEAPVWVNPAAPPQVVLMPLGQGHELYTRYAEGRGENPFTLVAAETDAESGALAWAATRVRVENVDRRVRMARFEGYLPAFQVDHLPIVRTIRPEDVE